MSNGNKRTAGLAAGLAAGSLGAYTYLQFRRDLAAAYERLEEGWQMVDTPAGPIQMATRGDGPPLLLVHGIGGGWDQSILISRLIGEGYRIIAPSRFGYLKTPLPQNAAPAAQAKAHAALLGALGIEQAIIVGASAGGPSAILFAANHPERCAGLVLLSAVTRPMQSQGLKLVFKLLYSSDFAMWLLKSLLVADTGSAGVMSSSEQSPATRQRVQDFTDTLLPVRPRQPGVFNDMHNLERFTLLPLERVRVPTFIVHAADDTTVPVRHGRGASVGIAGAEYLEMDQGGHLLMHGQPRIQERLREFLGRVS